jgi:PAS domain S-box-containing protein
MMRRRSLEDTLQTTAVRARGNELFASARQQNYARVDRIFIVLMGLQWAFGIVLALTISPWSYAGNVRSVHLHVYMAVFLGAAISALPVALALLRPGRPSTRYVIAVAQMLWSALLIHLSGGRIETHFHIFGSLALLAFYRDWRPLVPATIVVAADHFLRGALMPESVFGVANAEWWRFLEHAGWVAFENTFLTLSCIHGEREMHTIAARQADLEALSERDRSRSIELDEALSSVTELNDQLREELFERDSAEKEIARLTEERSLILDNAGDGIMGLDPTGQPTFMNAAASEMTGWTVTDLRASPRSAHDVMHRFGHGGASCRADVCPIHQAIVAGQRFHTPEEWLCRKDGALFPVEMRTAPILGRDGRMVGSVLTFHDISDRREIDRITELDRMKDEFISTVSHELRTPLTAIRGALGLLASGRVLQFPAKGQRLLDIAVANTDRLVKLINDILDIERMECGTLTLDTLACDSDALVRQAVDLVGPLLQREQIQVEIESLAGTFFADPDRLLQTLTNLLGNAIKFSPAHSTIRVTARRSGEDIVFSVADQGRGIPADRLQAIFERFQQIDATDSRDKGGSGLGLAICRSIVTQHGGQIQVDSVLGKGSCFSFSIPARPPVLREC